MTPALVPSRCRVRLRRRARRRSAGVVLVVTLLASILLAALVFYVFNLGRHAQQRVVAQNAADAAADAAAGWIARSLNSVAMHNVEMSRLIALVNVLDALPQATSFTLTDQQAALEAVQQQLARGVGDPHLRQALMQIQQDLTDQVNQLEPFYAMLSSGDDVRGETFYEGPAGRGRIWRAIEALDQASTAAMENLGMVAQLAAMESGRANLGDDAGTLTMALPLMAELPWQRGTFDDFRGPVIQGLPAIAQATDGEPDWHLYRGPFDAVFGWRDPDWRTQGFPLPQEIVDEWDSSWSSTPAPFQIISREATAYRTYGTHEWLLRLLADRAQQGVLYPSRFAWHLRQLADIKLGYLWPGTELRQTIEPRWVIDYDEAVRIRAAGSPEIHQVAHFVIDLWRQDTGGQLGPVQYEGWQIRYSSSPTFSPPGLPRVARYVWQDQRIEQTPSVIGGAVTIHRTRYYVFLGIDVGQEVTVRNPHNFADRAALPAPIDFVHDQFPPPGQANLDAAGPQPLRVLGIARRRRPTAMWPTRFDSDTPNPQIVALAQARVFNNHSWDLWTQMWRAQLEPISDYAGWVELLHQTADEAGQIPGLDAGQVAQLDRYLHSLEPLADQTLVH